MMELSWHWPWVFLLLPLPWVVRVLLPAKEQPQATLKVAHIGAWQQATDSSNEIKASGLLSPALLLALVVWLLLLTALARPYKLGEVVEMPISGRDLLLAVDLSPSMEIEDMQLNGRAVDRLVVTKKVLGDFIDRRVGDRLGLVLFGDEAYLQAPLTFDRNTVKELLMESQIGLAGPKTAIGDALGLSVKRLQNESDSSRVIILLTDGSNNAGELEPIKAAELAAQNNIRIYAVGLGAEAMQVASFFGTRTINPTADMDEVALEEIAKLTGGAYFRARNSQELNQIYALLNELEPAEQDPQVFRPQKNLYYWPLLWAFCLSLLLALQQSQLTALIGGRRG